MITEMLIVRVPGPPPVVRKMISNAFSTEVTAITTPVPTIGQMIGRLMYRSICSGLAPLAPT